ncbi:uncharacterized protein LOC128836071 [Malaclemys terrapin pileata]|uniref:uncharacterized protein LOC128836071 n=1 Tax=Malaclemys terrapin pileata TaxID=2991368 RepID=UPI0023A800E4|nr:uncharacterized protein LOC128836071 [Malaclemys terrapin pileata]
MCWLRGPGHVHPEAGWLGHAHELRHAPQRRLAVCPATRALYKILEEQACRQKITYTVEPSMHKQRVHNQKDTLTPLSPVRCAVNAMQALLQCVGYGDQVTFIQKLGGWDMLMNSDMHRKGVLLFACVGVVLEEQACRQKVKELFPQLSIALLFQITYTVEPSMHNQRVHNQEDTLTPLSPVRAMVSVSFQERYWIFHELMAILNCRDDRRYIPAIAFFIQLLQCPDLGNELEDAILDLMSGQLRDPNTIQTPLQPGPSPREGHSVIQPSTKCPRMVKLLKGPGSYTHPAVSSDSPSPSNTACFMEPDSEVK